jgi:hypothetical protein
MAGLRIARRLIGALTQYKVAVTKQLTLAGAIWYTRFLTVLELVTMSRMLAGLCLWTMCDWTRAAQMLVLQHGLRATA